MLHSRAKRQPPQFHLRYSQPRSHFRWLLRETRRSSSAQRRSQHHSLEVEEVEEVAARSQAKRRTAQVHPRRSQPHSRFRWTLRETRRSSSAQRCSQKYRSPVERLWEEEAEEERARLQHWRES